MIADEIFSRVTMPEVLALYGIAPGRHKRIKCPIHNGNGSNFSYNDNFYQCWTCGCKGNVISFTEQYFNINFSQAVMKLNIDFNLGISNRKPSIRDKEQMRLNEAINRVYKARVESHNEYYRNMTDLYRILYKTSLRGKVDGLDKYLMKLEDWLDENLEEFKSEFY